MKKQSKFRNRSRVRIEISPPRRLNEVRIAGNWSDSSVSHGIEDMRRVKKVRFADWETVHPLSCKCDACLINAKEPVPSKFADPKTSEYTFYKKLREDAGCNLHSNPLLKQNNKLKKSEANNDIRELNNMVKPNHEGSRPLFPSEIVTPIELKSLSPPRAFNESGFDRREESIFSRKRRRLLQLAVVSSNIDIDQCQLKGYDLVSILLQRLVPEGKTIARNGCVERRSRRMTLNDKSQLLVSSEPHIHFEKLPQNTRMNASPCPIRYLKNSSPERLSNRKIIFSQLENVDSDNLFTESHNEFRLQFERRIPENSMDIGRATCLHRHQRSFYDVHPSRELSFPGDGYLALNNHPTPSRLASLTHKNLISYGEFPEKSLDMSNRSSFEKLDGFCGTNEPETRRELCTQLLGWDSESRKREQDLLISSHNEIVLLNPHRRIAFEDWEMAEPSRLYSDSAFATWYNPDFNLCNFCSESDPSNVAGRQLTSKRVPQLVEPDNFLTVSCTSNYLPTLGDSFLRSSKHEEKNNYYSAFGSYKLMSEHFEEKVPANLDSLLLSSKHDFHLGLRAVTDCIGEQPSFNDFNIQSFMKDIALLTGDVTEASLVSSSKTTEAQFAKEMLSIYDFSSFKFRVSSDEDRPWPLLLDKESWDGSEEAACSFSEDH